MSKLEQAIEAVRKLPPAEQDYIADVILAATRAREAIEIDLDEWRDVQEGLAQVARGEVATEEEVEAALRSFRR